MKFPIKTIVAIGIAGIMSLFAIALPAVAISMIKLGEPTPDATIAASNSGGYYLDDNYFTFQPTLTKDVILSKLGSTYSDLRDAQHQKAIDDIIEKAESANVSQAIIMAFWSGEASFRFNDAEFGCGVPTGGGNQNPSFDAQLDCVVKPINAAISRDSNYVGGVYKTKPTETANTWTRLLYNYTDGNRDAPWGKYNWDVLKLGYVSDARDPRIVILRKLVPEQVVGTSTSDDNGIGLRIAGTARGQEGYKPKQNDCLIYNERTQAGDRYQWCVAFAVWVYNKATNSVTIPWDIRSTIALRDYFKNHPNTFEWKEKGTFQLTDLRAGDAFLEPSSSSSSGMHAGIIHTENGKYYTIEDNTSNDMVERRPINDAGAFVQNLIGVGRIK